MSLTLSFSKYNSLFFIVYQIDSIEQDSFYNSLILTYRSCFEPKALVPNLHEQFSVKFFLNQYDEKSLKRKMCALL